MIRLACTNCREVLTIDDAFAGGVCRCQHCGTIQTVPAATAANEVAVGGPNLGGGRNGSMLGVPQEGTGLDELAGAVVSSGLSSRRLLQPGDGNTNTAPARAPASRQNLVPFYAVAGVVIVALMGVVVYLAMRSSPSTTSGTGTGPTTPGVVADPTAPGDTPKVNPTAGPSFCGSPLAGDTVVYLLDRGSSMTETFAVVKEATLRSAASLGSDRNFQIAFWDNGQPPVVAPSEHPAYANKDNVESARRTIEDVIALSQSDVLPALKAALAEHPDTIVIVTAKGGDLDAGWAKAVLDARGTSAARIDTFSLVGNDRSAEGGTPPMKTVADRTGGSYVEVTPSDLKAAGE